VPAYLGFAPKTIPLHLTADMTGLRVTLASEVVKQSVTVGSDQPLSTESAANRDTVSISGDDLRKLPAFDLDYVSALSSFLDLSSVSSGGVTLIVDGIEMKSVGVSASAIQEVRINNDPYSAEFSRPGRGRIEVTTKPGSPNYHGEFNFLFRDAIFNAKNYFAVTRPPEVRRLFEGHFTGPVGHGQHTTFILSGEYGQRDTQAAVDAVELSGPVNLNVPTPQTNSQASMRVTHDFSPAHRLQVGYNYEANSNTSSGVGALVLPEVGTDTSFREDDLIFNDRIIISPTLINQLLITFEKDEDVTNSVTNARAIQVNGFFTGGGAQADSSRTENTIHVNEVVSWSHGRHYVRFGVQLPQFSRRAVDDHTNRLGTLSYASLANYPVNPATDLGTPQSFTAQQGIGRGIYWANEVGPFAQDQIKLNPRLQLTLGVRYDWVTYISDNNNFSPRLSLAYAPGKGKTILRLGAGVFYDRTGGDFPSIFKLHNGLVLDTAELLNPTAQQLAAGTFSAVPSTTVL
jgi:outer membrane receptor protein involved in Fe transport